MTAQFSGSGAQAEEVALEFVGRIRLSRAPHMKNKYLLACGIRSVDKALEYFRRVVTQSADPHRACCGPRAGVHLRDHARPFHP